MRPVADLSEAKAKVARAKEHFAALKAEMDARQAQSTVRLQRDGVWHVLSIDPIPEPSPHWALIAGDYINNLRSALEYAAWQLIIREGTKPGRSSAWPVKKNRQEWDSQVKTRKRSPELSPLYGLAPNGRAFAIIERSQPFNQADPESHWLSLLARLSNHDKHRALHAQETIPEIQGIDGIQQFITWSPGTIWHEFRIREGPLSSKEPTELFRISFRAGPGPRVRPQSDFVAEHRFGDGDYQLPFYSMDQLRRPIEAVLGKIARLSRVVGW